MNSVKDLLALEQRQKKALENLRGRQSSLKNTLIRNYNQTITKLKNLGKNNTIFIITGKCIKDSKPDEVKNFTVQYCASDIQPEDLNVLLQRELEQAKVRAIPDSLTITKIETGKVNVF